MTEALKSPSGKCASCDHSMDDHDMLSTHVCTRVMGFTDKRAIRCPCRRFKYE